MAHLTVTVPENSQNIFGTVTIKASLEKVFEAYTKALGKLLEPND